MNAARSTTWEAIVEVIREFREDGRPASRRAIKSKLVKKKIIDKAPCERTISKQMRVMDFRNFEIIDKPLLNPKMMQERFAYANWLKGRDFDRIVVVD